MNNLGDVCLLSVDYVKVVDTLGAEGKSPSAGVVGETRDVWDICNTWICSNQKQAN